MSTPPPAQHLERLRTVEDFLVFFAVPFDRDAVAAHRLRILQELRRELAAHGLDVAEPADLKRIRPLLQRAYAASVNGATGAPRSGDPSAAAEGGRTRVFIPLSAVAGSPGLPSGATVPPSASPHTADVIT